MRTQGMKNTMLILAIIFSMSIASFANTEGGKNHKKQAAEIAKIYDQVIQWVNDFNESELALENWMTETDYLESVSISSDFEEELQLESWMLNSNYLAPSWFKVETELELQIEDWMTDSLDQSIEPELTLESWMTDRNYLTPSYLETENEPELEYESWMLNTL
ncbi:MAG: hypothetical protein K9H64_21060 [Bacteroidales bacterium]|nr:hypothetical protein [Bacteroidales bacterium]MCF8458516.1 hypothetical protein [Bacteroidales bacterium]